MLACSDGQSALLSRYARIKMSRVFRNLQGLRKHKPAQLPAQAAQPGLNLAAAAAASSSPPAVNNGLTKKRRRSSSERTSKKPTVDQVSYSRVQDYGLANRS